MLLPQDVSKTENAYYATMAILYNILVNRLRAEELEDIDILFTPFCCDYGNMDEDESIKQILRGIKDYKNYKPIIFNTNTIIKEPNLYDQPKYYQNKQFFCINMLCRQISLNINTINCRKKHKQHNTVLYPHIILSIKAPPNTRYP
jgi:hypothetical protein